MIEKAYKKLRLDALVIQQGRLTQTAAKVGKDDLLSMVKYGAEQVFSSEPAKITDEDIDAIISKGESETVRRPLPRPCAPPSVAVLAGSSCGPKGVSAVCLAARRRRRRRPHVMRGLAQRNFARAF